MGDVTQILSQIEAGDPSGAEQLLPLVYDELRRLAARRLTHENSACTRIYHVLLGRLTLRP